MPRITPAHEQEVRDRIVQAAVHVFAEKGFHRATMQDVVRQSGLSVGAIYTYFKGKDELILAGCDLITGGELSELRRRVSSIPDFRDRLTAAIGFFFDQLDVERARAGGPRFLLEAWATADSEPAIREMLQARRRDMVGTAVALLQEGVAAGQLPSWLEIGPLANGFAALLDGIGLEAMEEGAGYRRAEAERRVLVILELLFAATGDRPDRLAPAPARPYESVLGTLPPLAKVAS
jgi:AcrR family transcriptional regulator